MRSAVEDVRVTGLYAVPSTVLVQQLPDQGILFLDLVTEEYFGLDQVGTAMYEAILSAGTLEAACDDLLEHYEVDRTTLLTDMRAFVDALLERNLLVHQSS